MNVVEHTLEVKKKKKVQLVLSFYYVVVFFFCHIFMSIINNIPQNTKYYF